MIFNIKYCTFVLPKTNWENMEFKAKDIATLLHGEIEGNDECTISDVSKIEEGKPGTLAFLSNPKYEHYIYSTEASVVLVNRDFKPSQPLKCTLIRVDSAYDSLATLLQIYESMRERPTGIEQPSYIDATAEIGENPYVGAFAYIGKGVKIGNNVAIYPQAYIGEGVTLGDNCTIYSGVKIYRDCKIGNNVTIHSGTVIGADGFGFAPMDDGTYKKVPQTGNVSIADNVEIGANTCIDRATMGSTKISEGVKLDNLIQIAHNVVVGENTVIAAQSGFAGSAHIGKHCVFGGQTGMVGHLTVGDNVQVAAQSGIAANIPANTILRGAPAFEYAKYQKCVALFRKLPEIYKDLYTLSKEVDKMKTK